MGKNKNNVTRRFSYAEPILYNGNFYPSADSTIVDDSGIERQGRIFADANGGYHTLDSNGKAMDTMLTGTLPEVVITPSKEDMLSNAFGRYLTRNDNTMVNNVPHREYNPQLREVGLRGAREHALWEKEHPNLSSWGYAASAVPFAVAAAPLVGGLATTAGNTALGQKVIDKAIMAMANPLVEMANSSIGLGFGIKGAYDTYQGNFTPSTALDLLGFPLAGKSSLDLVNKFRRNNSLRDVIDETPIPMTLKKEGARRYSDFINSQEYLDRLKNAGLEEHWEKIRNLTKERLNGIDYFPGRMQNIVYKDPKTLGLSDTQSNILNPWYGITLKKSLYPNRVMPTLDHEIAHWATKNAQPMDKGFLGDIMTYNEGIVPNTSWDDVLRAKINENPNMTIDDANKLGEYYDYWTDPQEKRARAMAIYQQAKDNNMTTDEFVDSWVDSNGKIYDFAPEQLRDMGKILNVNNLKKYLNNFLGISAPIGVSVSALNNNQNGQQ